MGKVSRFTPPPLQKLGAALGGIIAHRTRLGISG